MKISGRRKKQSQGRNKRKKKGNDGGYLIKRNYDEIYTAGSFEFLNL